MKEGKKWKSNDGEKSVKELRIYRWQKDEEENKSIDKYYVDSEDCGKMVMEGMIYIKKKIEKKMKMRSQ